MASTDETLGKIQEIVSSIPDKEAMKELDRSAGKNTRNSSQGTHTMARSEELLSGTMSKAIDDINAVVQEYEVKLKRMLQDILRRWHVRHQCLARLIDAAKETRDELVERKEGQMKNIQMLAGALNGLRESITAQKAGKSDRS